MTTTISARRVLTSAGELRDHAVTFADGRITGIEPTLQPPTYEILGPGFVDVQVNGHEDIDVATMTPDELSRMNELLAAQGVTSWCPTLVTSPLDAYEAQLSSLAVMAAAEAGPNILGVHLEGPYLGGSHGAHQAVPEGGIDLGWLAALPDIVSVMTLGPERPNALAAIELLTERGIVAALGHTAATYDRTRSAIDAGARLFTHVFNASAPLHHREPGAIGAALTDDRMSTSVIVDAVHVHPAVVELVRAVKPRDRLILVTDATAWRSGALGPRATEHRDGGPRLSDGTLAGSSLTMDRAVRNAVHQCGFDLENAMYAAATNPAQLVGAGDRGTLKVGARADMVALSPALTIQATWVAGIPIWAGSTGVPSSDSAAGTG